MKKSYMPDIIINSILELTPEFLSQKGIKGLVIDIDDTLVPHNIKEVPDDIKNWLKTLKDSGFKICAVSNNTKKRVAQFCNKLDIPFIYHSLKPLSYGYNKAKRVLELNADVVLAVGDQIFADIIGSKKAGMKTALVTPLSNRKGIFIGLKRKIEKIIIKNYTKS